VNSDPEVTYRKETQAANRAKWVAALRSGDYNQATGTLRKVGEDGSVSYCCLGVACELAVAAHVIPRPHEVNIGPPTSADGNLGSVWVYGVGLGPSQSYSQLPAAVREWLGLADSIGTTLRLPGHSDNNMDLTSLNDTLGASFNEIADTIESGLVRLEE
jgi:hypothetical protein